MWEQIQSNRRKTVVLVFGMAAVLIILGFILGESYARGGGVFGLAVAFTIWFVMTLVAWFQGDNIMLAVSGAKKVSPDDHPELWNVVEEMKIASGLPYMPQVYIINDMSMNAFAVGRKPEKAAVAVTAGLLAKLNRDELQGVVAHEVGHIRNRDVLLMTMLGVMLGAIVMISEGFLRGMFYGSHTRSRRRYSSKSKGNGQGQALMMVLAVVLAILAPILAQLIYFAVSRRREYLADASSAVFTRYPEGLASALEKLSRSAEPVQRANKATAAMYIINPFAKAKLSGLTSTHPPAAERISILRSIGNAASFGAYQSAWRTVDGKKAGKMPKTALQEDQPLTVRAADSRSAKSPKEQLRDAGDLLRKVNSFLFLPCVCGLKIKVPPDYNHDSIECPKCHRTLTVPVAQIAVAEQIADAIDQHAPDASPSEPRPIHQARRRKNRKPGDDQPPLRIRRGARDWMSFKCTCGHVQTLSPSFSAPRMTCPKCGRTIEIE
jgi:heat shock protein HtpX